MNATDMATLAASVADSGTRAGGATSQALLAGQIGAEVAQALSTALERMEQLTRNGHIDPHGLAALHDEILRARRVAILGQQVSRLAAGHVRQAPEAFELPQMLREAIAQRADEIAGRGVSVRQMLQPAVVSVDPSLLFSLLLSLLDWALEHGRAQTLTLATGLNTWPVHATLRCDFVWRAPDRLGPDAEPPLNAGPTGTGQVEATGLDTMAWRMVEQASRAMDVRITRHDSPSRVALALDFPEGPQHGSPLQPVATTRGGGGPDVQPLAGCRVLALATHAPTRRLLNETLLALGLAVDLAVEQEALGPLARAALPDALVIDLRSSEVDRMLAELEAGGSGPALVHVCASFKGLEISTSGRFEIVRVGRDDIARDLPAALRYAICGRCMPSRRPHPAVLGTCE